jgi:hypothetical protein
MLWTLSDPREDELVVVEFPYFETPAGTEFFEPRTYVDHDEDLASPRIISFNHGLGETITALAVAGMRIDRIEEHMSVPWNPLGTAMVELPNGEFQLREQPERLAASYTLVATKTR